jgi:hypothetical protein
MSPTFTLDTRAFDAALTRYADLSRHSLSYILNKKAMFVASFALSKTPQASKEALLSGLWNPVGLMRHKGGSFDTRPVARAIGIVQRKRSKQGKKGLYGRALTTAVNALIRKRTRAIRSLKAGWFKPLKDIQRAVRESAPGDSDKFPRVKSKGYGAPANPAKWDTFALLSYQLASRNTAGQFYLDPRVVSAAQAALDDEARNMNTFVESELAKAAQKAGVA